MNISRIYFEYIPIAKSDGVELWESPREDSEKRNSEKPR